MLSRNSTNDLREGHCFNIPNFEPMMHFNHAEHPARGVNGKHFVNMDSFLPQHDPALLHVEILKGLSCMDSFFIGNFIGAMPPEEEERLFQKSWTSILASIDEHDPTGIHKKAILHIKESEKGWYQKVRNYIMFALGACIPWYFVCYLKKNEFTKKSTQISDWTTLAKEKFPELIKFIECLDVFESVGRVLIFASYPHAGVPIHRDYVLERHQDHNINFFFEQETRPSFVFSEGRRYYLEQGVKSYFFNNRDYHGVDPENCFKYTLRVDGRFTSSACDKLGLVNGEL